MFLNGKENKDKQGFFGLQQGKNCATSATKHSIILILYGSQSKVFLIKSWCGSLNETFGLGLGWAVESSRIY